MKPALLALATYRVTKLATEDKITEPLRDALFNVLPKNPDSKLRYLASCPNCISVWAAAGLIAFDYFAPEPVSKLVIQTLAASAVTGILYERVYN